MYDVSGCPGASGLGNPTRSIYLIISLHSYPKSINVLICREKYVTLFSVFFLGSYSLLLIIPGRAPWVCGPFVCFQSSALRRFSFVLFVTLLHQCMMLNNDDDVNQICCYHYFNYFLASKRPSFVHFVTFLHCCAALVRVIMVMIIRVVLIILIIIFASRPSHIIL